MREINRGEMFNVHKGNITSILAHHDGFDDRAIDEITEYIMTRISQVIRKERKKRELLTQRKDGSDGYKAK